METNTDQVETQDAVEQPKAASPFAILMELEGLAANGRRAAFEVLKSMLGERKVKLEPVQFSRYCLHPSPAVYVPRLLEALGEKVSADKLVEDVNSGVVMNLSSNSSALLPGLTAVLDAAKARDFSVGLLTLLPEASAESLVKKLGLDKWDAGLYTSEDEGEGVFPRADSWLRIARDMGRSPRRCLVLASNRDSARAALAAGMACVVVPDEFTSFQDFGGADKVLDSLEEVPAVELLDELLPEER